MKPKKGSGSSDMDEPAKDPLQLLKELVLLIVEARTPVPSVKGRVEGPHCPVIRGRPAHKCNVERQECIRANEFCSLGQQLWSKSVPVCLEVLLLPDCQHGRQEVEVTEGGGVTTTLTAQNAVLVERWNIEVRKSRQEDSLGPSLLLQAVRSFLHFSQISSWLYTSEGKLPSLLAYRVCAPADEMSLDFQCRPESHTFPVSFAGFHRFTVSVQSLPRQDSVPRLQCSMYDCGICSTYDTGRCATSNCGLGPTSEACQNSCPTHGTRDSASVEASRESSKVLHDSHLSNTSLQNLSKFKPSPPLDFVGVSGKVSPEMFDQNTHNVLKDLVMHDKHDAALFDDSRSHCERFSSTQASKKELSTNSGNGFFDKVSEDGKRSTLVQGGFIKGSSDSPYKNFKKISTSNAERVSENWDRKRIDVPVDSKPSDMRGLNPGARRSNRLLKKDGEKDLRIEQMKCEAARRVFGHHEEEESEDFRVGKQLRQDMWTERCDVACLEPRVSLFGQKLCRKGRDLDPNCSSLLMHDKEKLMDRHDKDVPLLYAERKKRVKAQKEAMEEEFIRKLSDRLASVEVSSNRQKRDFKGLLLNRGVSKKSAESGLTYLDEQLAKAHAQGGQVNVNSNCPLKPKTIDIADKSHQGSSPLTVLVSEQDTESDSTPMASPEITPRAVKEANGSLERSLAKRSIRQNFNMSATKYNGSFLDGSDKGVDADTEPGHGVFESQISRHNSHDTRVIELALSDELAGGFFPHPAPVTFPLHPGSLPESNPLDEAANAAEIQKWTEGGQHSPISRRIFEENLLPLVSYDAKTDSFKQVEQTYSNILHSPKVLFSYDVPQGHSSNSQKCIDFGKALETEFFTSKVHNALGPESIGRYMSDIASLSRASEGAEQIEENNDFELVRERNGACGDGLSGNLSQSVNRPEIRDVKVELDRRNRSSFACTPSCLDDSGLGSPFTAECNRASEPKTRGRYGKSPESSGEAEMSCPDSGGDSEKTSLVPENADSGFKDMNTSVNSCTKDEALGKKTSKTLNKPCDTNAENGVHVDFLVGDSELESSGTNCRFQMDSVPGVRRQLSYSEDVICENREAKPSASDIQISDNFKDISELVDSRKISGHPSMPERTLQYHVSSTFSESIEPVSKIAITSSRSQISPSPSPRLSPSSSDSSTTSSSSTSSILNASLIESSFHSSRAHPPRPESTTKSMDGNVTSDPVSCDSSYSLNSSSKDLTQTKEAEENVLDNGLPASQEAETPSAPDTHLGVESPNQKDNHVLPDRSSDHSEKSKNKLHSKSYNKSPMSTFSSHLPDQPSANKLGHTSHQSATICHHHLGQGHKSLQPATIFNDYLGQGHLSHQPVTTCNDHLGANLYTNPNSLSQDAQSTNFLAKCSSENSSLPTDFPGSKDIFPAVTAMQLAPQKSSCISRPGPAAQETTVSPVRGGPEPFQHSDIFQNFEHLRARSMKTAQRILASPLTDESDASSCSGPRLSQSSNAEAKTESGLSNGFVGGGHASSLSLSSGETLNIPSQKREVESFIKQQPSAWQPSGQVGQSTATPGGSLSEDLSLNSVPHSSPTTSDLDLHAMTSQHVDLVSLPQLQCSLGSLQQSDSRLAPTRPDWTRSATSESNRIFKYRNPNLKASATNQTEASVGGQTSCDSGACSPNEERDNSRSLGDSCFDGHDTEMTCDGKDRGSNSVPRLGDAPKASQHSPAQIGHQSGLLSSPASPDLPNSQDTSPPSVQNTMPRSISLVLEGESPAVFRQHRHFSDSGQDDIFGYADRDSDKQGLKSEPTSPPAHESVPGWSSTPPQRTMSTPSEMNLEGKVKGQRSSYNSSVIQQRNCDKSESAGLRKIAARSVSMIFNSRTGLPSQSSPAPLKRKSSSKFDYDASLLSTKALKNAFSCSRLTSSYRDKGDEDSRRTLSTSAPASTNCLLGNFEESILNGRIDPVGTVDGFTAEIGASGSFCPKHLHVPVTAFFFALSDDNAPSPYLGHINLETIGHKGYHVPKKGNIQVTLFNPNKTVVKMFVVAFDLSDMPPSCQTFVRQRTVYQPTDPNSDQPSYLRYLIHLRCASSKSGKIYLHTDIRLIFARHKANVDAKSVPYQLKSFTEGPQNPKYSPKK